MILLISFGGIKMSQRTCKYCNEKYPNQFAFNMTTNGTLLTEEKCIFLAQNNFDLMISFDGIKNIQDINRPHHSKALSSYDLIIDNLPIILKYLPGVYPRATVNFD